MPIVRLIISERVLVTKCPSDRSVLSKAVLMDFPFPMALQDIKCGIPQINMPILARTFARSNLPGLPPAL
jgi:hypothetical protein